MKLYILLSLWMTTIVVNASAPIKKPTKELPVQEKVYLHFDNNCYFQGDTIWYKAYVVLADDNSPQPLSRILYVELLNEQGYIVERQQLTINKKGQANGQFAIADSAFAGFYEIRAYTKWMLNFGFDYTRPWYSKNGITDEYIGTTLSMKELLWDHKQALSEYLNRNGYTAFSRLVKSLEISIPEKRNSLLKEQLEKVKTYLFQKDDEHNVFNSIDPQGMRKNYRDYHNLFSRVIPIYNRPDTAELYMSKIMPKKVTTGDYDIKWKNPGFDVKFYPEGGYMLEGEECRVAWEAMNEQLERLNVRGVLLEDGEPIDSLLPCHAGRGVFTLTPMHGKNYKVRFVFKEHKFDFDLPKAEQEGVRLWVEQDEEGVYFDIAQHFEKPRKLTLNVYCRGKKAPSPFLIGGLWVCPIEDLSEGVNQAVVVDSLGNVYADRLFFVNKLYESQAKVIVLGANNHRYAPLEKVRINLIATDARSRPLKHQTFSVSVRDADQLDASFASGNVMTNLLLESDLKGFVENPDYYFEADDEQHRQALDILMLVQGWRRYDWRFVENPEYFNVDYLPEQKMVIYGQALPLRKSLLRRDKGKLQISCSLINDKGEMDPEIPFVYRGVTEADSGGYFQFAYDPFYGKGKLTLRAKYVNKLEKKNYDLVTHDPEIFIRKQYYYPQALKEYSWYETHLLDIVKDKHVTWEERQKDIYASEWIPQVNIKQKKRVHLKLQKDRPVAQIDFLDFMNDLWDQGYYDAFNKLENHYFSLEGTLPYINDYVRMQYQLSENNYERGETYYNWSRVPLNNNSSNNWIWDSSFPDHSHTSGDSGWGFLYDNPIARIETYSFIDHLKRIDIVSDAPRRPTSFEHEHQDKSTSDYTPSTSTPPVGIDAYVNIVATPDSLPRIIFGREYTFQGFNRPVEYYNPDYSKARLPDVKDYRRTLYWNPNVTTDNYGQVTIEFYNSSVCTSVDVSAEGVTRHGQYIVTEQ
ncbi:MAG: hypothetical protein K5899_04620 [Bacteroidaceae bacterium]|nr:hypothetical protein [Bacteroidaceae bacterium]